MELLRPALYDRLVNKFGSVKVYHRGETASLGLRPAEGGQPSRAVRYCDTAQGHRRGEIYAVCCPYCGDDRHRLHFSHLWGAVDVATGSRLLWLAWCYNEERCLSGRDRQRELYEHVWDDSSPPAGDRARYGRPSPPGEAPGRLEPPGTIWPVDRLLEDHPAVLYLRDRRFDPAWLATAFGVGYVATARPECLHTIGRLYIPVCHGGRLAGWQARHLGKPPPGVPKYFSAAGMPRGRLLYNFDGAVRQPFVVVVEGPTDVWRFGPEAVAVFGKPTAVQAEMVAAHWRRVVVLLDADAARESAQLLARLNSLEVVEVGLPDDRDPADYDRGELRDLVSDAAHRAGVSLWG